MDDNVKVKKYLIVIGIIIVIAINFMIIISKEVTNLDELWNFNMANQFARGLVPYKDISMVMTPFSTFFAGMILAITGKSLFSFRILGTLLVSAISILGFDIARKTTNKKLAGFVFMLVTETLLFRFLTYDYNFMILLLGEIILDLEITKYIKKKEFFNELKERDADYKKRENQTFSERYEFRNYDVAIGIITGLAICTKQTIGLFFVLAIIIAELLDRNFPEGIETKQRRKIKRRVLFIRFISMLIPVVLLMIYFLITKSFNDFVSYTVVGVKEFSNSRSYITLVTDGKNLLIAILASLMPVYLFFAIIYLLIVNKEKVRTNLLQMLIIYSIPMLVLIYPIADTIHFLLGIYILGIALTFSIVNNVDILLEKINAETKAYITKSFLAFIILVCAFELGSDLFKYVPTYTMNVNNVQKLKHMEGLYVPEYLSNRVYETNKKVNELLETGAEVYILDGDSVICDLVNDRYIKDYDMFNYGNFGAHGLVRIQNKINASENTYYFIRKASMALNWQTPKEIINSIRDNMEDTGEEVGIFHIYYAGVKEKIEEEDHEE